MPMAINILALGKKIKYMDRAFSFLPMAIDARAFGKMIK